MSTGYRFSGCQRDPDDEFDEFRDRVDGGEQCPDCHSRGPVSVAVDTLHRVWFHCERCRHEWLDPWSNQ